MKCLVTGAYGFLGESLCCALERSGHQVFRVARREGAQICADAGNQEQLADVFKTTTPDVVINLVAMTNVDDCERNPDEAFKANAGVVRSICGAIRQTEHAHLVHVSTDQVYNGTGPHIESAAAWPTNVYAITKYSGELIAQQVGATILRTNFVGHSKAKNRTSFSDWLIDAFQTQREITLFDDVFFSPLGVETLCRAIERTATQRIAGTFNAGARGGMSKAEFGLTLARSLGYATNSIAIGSVKTAKMAARRPSDMKMDSSLFESTFSFQMPTVENEIERIAASHLSSKGQTHD